jgi:hypothetical protein
MLLMVGWPAPSFLCSSIRCNLCSSCTFVAPDVVFVRAEGKRITFFVGF